MIKIPTKDDTRCHCTVCKESQEAFNYPNLIIQFVKRHYYCNLASIANSLAVLVKNKGK